MCPLWVSGTDSAGWWRHVDLGLIDEKAIRADLARGAAGLQIPLATLDQILGAEI